MTTLGIPRVHGARGAKSEAMRDFNRLVDKTPNRNCVDDPVPYTEIVQSADEAEYLCEACPIIEQCFAQGRRTKPDGLVLGGRYWRKGKPI